MMRTIPISVSFALMALGTSCERVADVSSPLSYAKEGISFLYPGNWKIEDDENLEGTKFLSVESPGDALFLVMESPDDGTGTLQEFVKSFSESFGGEIPIGTVEKPTSSDIQRKGKTGQLRGIRQRIEISLLGERTSFIQEFFAVKASGKTAFLVCQSPEEDFDKTEPAFDQIIGSFKYK